VVIDGGFKYRTYNSIATVSLEDEDNGGCGAVLPADQWVVIHRINVNNNTGCTEFQIINDAYTAANNRNFYISLNGEPKTGAVQANSVLRGNCTEDCLGVIGGPALPGTSCNDNNVCTINDTWDANCNCAGTFQDTDSDGVCDANDNCPTVPGQIGSACNDGDDCTINDVLDANCNCVGTFQDTDSDGVCDANDNCPTVPGQIGSACNDGDDCTINDVLDANCNCVGTFQDTDSDGVCDANDNCPTVPGQIGSACNDGDDCTINDVLDANCNCVGTFQDTDNDGICDANDPCPLLANLAPGDACDDGNANTINDLVNVNCICAGTLLDDDCEGVPGGPAQPGTACNDNNDCTINDVYDANCNCAGTFQDTDSDGVCDANDACPLLPFLVNGDACDDGNANTINDVVTNCICAGTLLDDDCEGVPGGPAQPGIVFNDYNDCPVIHAYPTSRTSARTFQDTDSDGVCDANDACPLWPTCSPVTHATMAMRTPSTTW